jgi:hypothetical protein
MCLREAMAYDSECLRQLGGACSYSKFSIFWLSHDRKHRLIRSLFSIELFLLNTLASDKGPSARFSLLVEQLVCRHRIGDRQHDHHRAPSRCKSWQRDHPDHDAARSYGH